MLINVYKQELKESYLTFRRTILGDTADIFSRRNQITAINKSPGSRTTTNISTTVGPTPFTSMSNAAAVAMASAVNRTQTPSSMSTMFFFLKKYLFQEIYFLCACVTTHS